MIIFQVGKKMDYSIIPLEATGSPFSQKNSKPDSYLTLWATYFLDRIKIKFTINKS